MIHDIWAEKWRPSSFETYLFQNDNDKASILDALATKQIPHLLLSGIQGTGKTSLVKLIIKELGIDTSDVLRINCSNDTGIDLVRDRIDSFVRTSPIGIFKCVVLEEADGLTPFAQRALKNLIEERHETARFFFTCNNSTKIIPEIKSRCQEYHFGALEKSAVTELAANILIQENINFTLETLDFYVDKHFPDIRRLIGALQQYSINGMLCISEIAEGSYVEMIKYIDENKWNEAIDFARHNIEQNQWESVFRPLYEILESLTPFKNLDKWQQAIVIIAEYMYKHQFVADKQINGVAMLISLSRIK